MKKEKRERMLWRIGGYAVLLVLVVWIGVSAYNSFHVETRKFYDADTTAVDTYLSGLTAEIPRKRQMKKLRLMRKRRMRQKIPRRLKQKRTLQVMRLRTLQRQRQQNKKKAGAPGYPGAFLSYRSRRTLWRS